jgi:hypothetical protein
MPGPTGQASIVAYNNLYSGCGGTVPSVYRAHYIGAGSAIQSSPVFSLDGAQRAFVQADAEEAAVILLKWGASTTETVQKPMWVGFTGPYTYGQWRVLAAALCRRHSLHCSRACGFCVEFLGNALKMFAEDRYDPPGSFPIPKRRTLELARGFLQDGSSRRENTLWIHSHYLIRSMLNRRRPLSILAQRKARHAEDGGFFLHSAGVGQHNARPVIDRKEVDVSERIERHDSSIVSPR